MPHTEVYHDTTPIPLCPKDSSAAAKHKLGTPTPPFTEWLSVHYETPPDGTIYCIRLKYRILNERKEPLHVVLGESHKVAACWASIEQAEAIHPGEERILQLSIRPTGGLGVNWSIDVGIVEINMIRTWRIEGQTP